MRTNDGVDQRIRRIGAERLTAAASSTKCGVCKCVYVGTPEGAMQPACCDDRSPNYHMKITHIERCRRWTR